MALETTYRKQLREKIIDSAMQEFTTRGIRSVTMDEIARKLLISKRTLYEIFSNKEELLLEGMKKGFQREYDMLVSYTNSQESDVIDVLMELYRIRMSELSEISPTFIIELGKYPKVMRFFQERSERRQREGVEYVKRGIAEGYIRSDINLDLIFILVDAALDSAMKKEIYKKFDMKTIYKNVLLLMLGGISTIKGQKKIEEELAKLNI